MENKTQLLRSELQTLLDTEKRRAKRTPVKRTGRLAFGGLTPGMVGCQILDLSETGVRVRTFATLDPVPEFFSIEFCDVFSRARLRWSKDQELGLEFIFD
ncbi:MAG: PilZ domain-containing protein [Acidocella sp.]